MGAVMLKKYLFTLAFTIFMAGSARAEAPKTTIYYFHGNTRCATCNKMEKYTVSAVEEKFAQNLADGLLEIKVVNVDLPENKHFVQDYKLYTKAVILAKGNGQWKNLDRIWTLVKDEKNFRQYIEIETATFIAAP